MRSPNIIVPRQIARHFETAVAQAPVFHRIASSLSNRTPRLCSDRARNRRAVVASERRAIIRCRTTAPLQCASLLSQSPLRCMSFSRTTASSRPAPSSPTTTRRCRSRRRPASGSKIKAASVLLRFADAGAGGAARRGAGARGRARSGFPVGSERRRRIRLRRSRARVLRPRARAPREAAAVAMLPARVADVLLQEGQGPLPQGARRRAARPRSRRSSASEREAEQIDGVGRASCSAHRLPAALRDKLPMLLYKPDKNTLEWKALAAACDARRRIRVALLAACGAIPSTHDYHFNASCSRRFRAGIAFPALRGAAADCRELPRRRRARVLDRRRDDHRDRRRVLGARARQRQPRDRHPHRRAGARRSRAARALDAIARARLSTVYMPGRKITMLPETAIARFTLAAGRGAPALSLYVEIDADGTPLAHAHARRARADRRQPAPRRDRRGVRAAPPSPAEPPWTARAARAVEARAAPAKRRAARPTSTRDRLQLLRRLGRGAPTAASTIVPRAARLAARQARRRADDPRQQHVGHAARRCRRRRDSTACSSGGKVQHEHASRRAPGTRASRTTCGRARRCAATAISSTSASCSRRSPATAPPYARERRRAVRRAGRFRGDLRAVRRVPGPDGALLVPALAAAGKRRARRRRR